MTVWFIIGESVAKQTNENINNLLIAPSVLVGYL